MPRAVDEPVVTIRRDDERRVDSIVTEVGIPVVRTGACPVLAFVGHGTQHKAFVNPLVRSRIAGLHHADESPLSPRVVEVGLCVLLTCLDIVIDDDAIVHAVEVAAYTASTWCPIAVNRTADGWQAESLAAVVQ